VSCPPWANLQSGGWALLQHFAAEAKQRRRTAAFLLHRIAGRLHEGAALDQATEVLLVQMPAGDRLDGALKLGQGELGRHQLENDGGVFELGPKARNRRRQNPAVVEAHGDARRRRGLSWRRHRTSVALGLDDKAGFIEKLIAVEDAFLVPAGAFLAEGE